MSASKESTENYSTHFCLGLAIVLLGTLFRGYVLQQQPGPYLDDEIGHYIIARDAWSHPEFIFSFWGRPGCTLFFMPGALFSLTAARWFALLSISVCSYLLLPIAKELRLRHLWLAPLLFEVQPWVINYTGSVLTQPPAVFAFTLGFYLYLREKGKSSGFVLGWLPLIRHETIVLNALIGLYMLIRRQIAPILMMGVPLLAICTLCYLLYDVNFLSPFFQPKGTDIYGKGTWLTYVRHLFADQNAGPLVTILAFLGLPTMCKSRKRAEFYSFFLLLLVTHTVIYKFGLYSSGGFGIFLLPIAPVLAVSSASFIEAIVLKLSRYAKALLIIVLLVAAIRPLTLRSFERPFNGEARYMRTTSEWIRENFQLDEQRIMTTNIWAYYWLPYTVPTEGGAWFKSLWSKNFFEQSSAGDLVIWDDHYSERWGYKLEELMRSPEWKLLFEDESGFAKVFQKQESVENDER